MTNKESVDIITEHLTAIKANPLVTVADVLYEAYDNALQALDLVEKIKKTYANCYNAYLKTLNDGFSDEHTRPFFYQDVARSINDILCDAYDTDEDLGSWIKEYENDQ